MMGSEIRKSIFDELLDSIFGIDVANH